MAFIKTGKGKIKKKGKDLKKVLEDEDEEIIGKEDDTKKEKSKEGNRGKDKKDDN